MRASRVNSRRRTLTINIMRGYLPELPDHQPRADPEMKEEEEEEANQSHRDEQHADCGAGRSHRCLW